MGRKAQYRLWWWNYPNNETMMYCGRFLVGVNVPTPWDYLWSRRDIKLSPLHLMLRSFDAMPKVHMSRGTFPKTTVIQLLKSLRQQHAATILEAIKPVGGGAKRSVMTPEGAFLSLRKAADALGISATTVSRRIREQPEQWYFIEETNA